MNDELKQEVAQARERAAITVYLEDVSDRYAARYNALCTAFHESQRLYCEEITRQQAANLRKKRQLRGLRSGIRSQRNFITGLTAVHGKVAEYAQECTRLTDRVSDLEMERAGLRARVAELEDALGSSLGWLRMIDERRSDVPQWLRHDADPRPIRKRVEKLLKATRVSP